MPASRLDPLEPPYDPAIADMLAKTMPPGWPDTKPLALFRTLARHEALAEAFFGFGRFFISLRADSGSVLDLRSRELVILRITARSGCAYEWGVHARLFAEAADLDGASLDRLAGRLDPSDWNPRDHALLSAVDELDRGARLSDAAWRALSRHYDEKAVLEILLLAGWYRAIAYLANGPQIAGETWAAALPQGDPD